MRTPLPSSSLDAAQAWFGSAARSSLVYANLLATRGVDEGLLGPGEAATVWTRHVLNSALLAQLISPGCHVIDVGSGAGLPGIPLALARPDLIVTLLEPMARRVRFLADCRRLMTHTLPAEAPALRLPIVRARAESLRANSCDLVVARAVAPLDRLIPLVLPRLRPGGRLLALKGRSAEQEMASLRPTGQFSLSSHHLERDGHRAVVVEVIRSTRGQRAAR